LNILFLGTSEFACPSLEALVASPYRITEVITQPDRPKGRGRKLTPPPVKPLALARNIPVFQPEKLRDPSAVENVKSLKPDLIVVVAYGQILSAAVLSVPPLGCVNVHGSLLPKYRGAAPIARAILMGEKKTGVTTMLLDTGMDTGPIFLQEEVGISPEDSLGSLQERLAQSGAALLLKTIEGLAKGHFSPRPQDATQASYAPKILREEGRIDWRRPARELGNLLRALDPSPGAYSTWNGKIVKFFRPLVLEAKAQDPPGAVAEAADQGLKIATVDGYLLIREIQMENRSRMAVGQFLRGNRMEPGQRLGD